MRCLAILCIVFFALPLSLCPAVAQDMDEGESTTHPAADPETSWLPPRVEEGVAQQLAERMKLLGDGASNDERILAAARATVAAIRGLLEGWGETGVLERTPDLPALELPVSGDRYLDAMMRFQICNAILMVQLNDPAYQDDQNARVTSVFGLTAITLAVLRLRHPFVAQGRNQAEIEAHLTSPDLEPALEGIQTNPDLRGHAESGCQPVLVELLEKPLQSLGED